MNLANPEAALAFSADEIAFPLPDGRQDDLGLVAKAVVQRARARLDDWNAAGASGAQIVTAFTEVMDRTVAFLHAAAVADFTRRNARVNQKCAVLAQGGYGRGELNPFSDVDLLFLYPWKVNPFVESVAEKILYSLWDTGMQLGHAVRSVPECARLAARDFKVKTALLDARFLCGDADLGGLRPRRRDRHRAAQPRPFPQGGGRASRRAPSAVRQLGVPLGAPRQGRRGRAARLARRAVDGAREVQGPLAARDRSEGGGGAE